MKDEDEPKTNKNHDNKPEDKASKADLSHDDEQEEPAKSDTGAQKTNQEEDSAAEEQQSEEAKTDQASKQGWLKSCWQWWVRHKGVSIPAYVILAILVLLAIPFTRYTLAGLVLKQQFSIVVLDSQNQKPVTSATVRLGGQEVATDNQGKASIRAKVGKNKLEVSKKYYETSSSNITVPILRQRQEHKVELFATGRPVPVAVLNSISKKPVANVIIAAEDTEAKTDQQGKAIMVVPSDKTELMAVLKGEGYNQTEVNLTVTTEEVGANSFNITPAGKIYFLSNQSGKIDVVETNLDGTERKVILAGTGKEDKSGTILLASRDWKYLALRSKRDDGDNAKLFLIDTATGQASVMDEGNADFSLVGWSEHYFVYQVDRKGLEQYDPKQQALKSFNAETRKIKTLAETDGSGGSNWSNYYRQEFAGIFILGDTLIYLTRISAYPTQNWADKEAEVTTIKPDGSVKTKIAGYKDTDNSSGIHIYTESRSYRPKEVYFAVYTEQDKLFEYENGKIKEVEGKKADDLYSGAYYTYLVSPSGGKTFWSEERDGKPVLFVGDADGNDPKQIASAPDYTQYGWFTDEYLLVSKKGSELFILPAVEWPKDQEFLKISDYYKPNYSFQGYGYGYGGL